MDYIFGENQSVSLVAEMTGLVWSARVYHLPVHAVFVLNWERHGLLLKGLHCLLLIFEDLEEVKQADHLQGLLRELTWVEQFESTARLLSVGQTFDQEPNPARVKHRHFRQINHHAAVAASKQIVDCLAQPIHGLAQREPTAQLDDLHRFLCSDVDLQRMFSPSQSSGRWSSGHGQALR